MDIANANNVFVQRKFSVPDTMSAYVEHGDPNWKSQKTKRKNWRRLSNAPKAVRKRMGFRERRG